jgi:hypothetical protein
MRPLVSAAALVLLAGCAVRPAAERAYIHLGGLVPKAIHVEFNHVSHLTAGWPMEAQKNTEDGLTTANLFLEWRPTRNTYLLIGEGWNLKGRNGGGFYGPSEIFTARVGHTIPLRRD